MKEIVLHPNSEPTRQKKTQAEQADDEKYYSKHPHASGQPTMRLVSAVGMFNAAEAPSSPSPAPCDLTSCVIS